MGMHKAVKCRPVSREPLDIRLADALAKAGPHKPRSLIPLLASGRRFGQSAGARCNYMILNQKEIAQLKNEVTALLNDRSKHWEHPDVPKIATEALVPPLETALADPSVDVFARLT
jgi:hypothetical protein